MNRIKFDKKLFALIILLFIIGVIFVYSASWPYAQRLNYASNYFAKTINIWYNWNNFYDFNKFY